MNHESPHKPLTDFDRQDSIWDYFQNESPESFAGSLPRLHYMLNPIPAGRKVLNIGVGTGMLEKLAQDKGIDIYAMDPVPKSVESLQKALGLGDKAKVGYGEAIPFEDNMFDEVIATEVLEHLSDEAIAASLGEIRRILKPGGHFSGSVPARENLATQIVVCPCCAQKFHRWGHQQSFTTGRMRGILATQFAPGTVKEEMFVPYNILNAKGKADGFARKLLFKLGVQSSGCNVVFRVPKAG